MKIHIYDPHNRLKLAQFRGDDFSNLSVSKTIDDFHSLTFRAGMTSPFHDLPISGSENIYIEDDDGSILFGGIMTTLNIDTEGMNVTCYDHRWLFSRLILDTALVLRNSDDVISFVSNLVDMAKAKRSIPLAFDVEGSAINTNFRADLHFEVGDSIGGALQKIIQTIYARWAVRYEKVDGNIVGKLVVRSVLGVTPEGIGISQGFYTNEGAEPILLRYEVGSNQNNIQSFNFTQDFSRNNTRTKVGIRLNDQPVFVDTNPIGVNAFIEMNIGRSEAFVTDYKANSVQTGTVIGEINQTYPRSDFEVQLTPDFQPKVIPGDRVSIYIDTPQLIAKDRALVRIDRMTYVRMDGYWQISMFVNAMNPQKRTGTTGLIEAISGMDQGLDGLNKNYFNN